MAANNRLGILVVDDDESIYSVVVDTMMPYGQVYFVKGVNDALQIIKNRRIDLLLINIVLESGEDTVALLKDIKKDHDETKVIVINGADQIQTVTAWQQMAIWGVLQKPFKRPELQKVVNLLYTPTVTPKHDVQARAEIEAPDFADVTQP